MTTGAWWALAASIIWGLVYRLEEKALGDVSVYKLYFIQCVTGAVVAAGLLVARGEPLAEVNLRATELKWLMITVVCYTLANVAILQSIVIMGAARSAVLEISYPVFVIVAGVLVFRDTLPNFWFFLGAALIGLGSWLVLTRS